MRTEVHIQIRSFGFMLSPDLHRRPNARPVSYYALFKWWLLLSQHPGCLSIRTSLSTKRESGTLAGDLGCFPLDSGGYSPKSDCRDSRHGIRSLVETSSLGDPRFHSVSLPPQRSCPTLAQKLFRGEPDISQFD